MASKKSSEETLGLLRDRCKDRPTQALEDYAQDLLDEGSYDQVAVLMSILIERQAAEA